MCIPSYRVHLRPSLVYLGGLFQTRRLGPDGCHQADGHNISIGYSQKRFFYIPSHSLRQDTLFRIWRHPARVDPSGYLSTMGEPQSDAFLADNKYSILIMNEMDFRNVHLELVARWENSNN